MPKKVVTRTGVPGATPDARRLLSDAVAAGVPPDSTDQTLGALLNRNEFIHLLFDVSGTNPVFTLQVWYFSSISGIWHRGEAITVNNKDIVSAEIQGLNRVYLEVIGVAGTGTPTLQAWLALVVPV